jgi:hypothetical protein
LVLNAVFDFQHQLVGRGGAMIARDVGVEVQPHPLYRLELRRIRWQEVKSDPRHSGQGAIRRGMFLDPAREFVARSERASCIRLGATSRHFSVLI